MNTSIFYFFYNIGQNYPALDWMFVFLAEYLPYLTVVVLLYYLFAHEDKKRGVREIATMVAIATLAWILAHAIKYFYYTPRPFVLLQGIMALFPQESDASFPSGHATFFSALAMGMYFYHKKIAAVLAVVALLIGLARIITGVHFPLDILAGFVLGPAIAVIVYFLIKKMSQMGKFAKQSENG